jgi:hypothetical protein
MVRGAIWKSGEIELIKKFYSDYGKEKLMQLLPNRTWRAISDEAQRLGIKVNVSGLRKTFHRYSSNVKIGALGEELAKALLESEGCKVFDFKTAYGIKDNKMKKLVQLKEFLRTIGARSHLPDYVAFEGSKVFIVEVKTGQSTLYPSQRKILLKSLDYGLTPIVVNVTASKHFLSRSN